MFNIKLDHKDTTAPPNVLACIWDIHASQDHNQPRNIPLFCSRPKRSKTMSDSVDVIKPTNDVDEVIKRSVLPDEAAPVPREAIPWHMWRTALLITSQSFMYGYVFAGLNTGLVTGTHGNGSDCYHGTDSCPPGSVYKDINMSTSKKHKGFPILS